MPVPSGGDRSASRAAAQPLRYSSTSAIMFSTAAEENSMIPLIDITPLFAADGAMRRATDAEIMSAATGSGFITVMADGKLLPATASRRAQMLELFSLPAHEKRKLWRQKYAPEHANVYRGYFPLLPGPVQNAEGFDMGPDVAHRRTAVADDDPLLGATPFPPEGALPGWREATADYYRALEATGRVLMASIARGLGLEERFFDSAFVGGNSTLRFLHYPEREAAEIGEGATFAEHNGATRRVIGAPHVDSGFVTLLAQDGVEGLQALAASGEWVDVPAREGTVAVNFGGLLERWTGGRIKATRHRVLSPGRRRFSIPFFYEPRVDAVIEPLPLPGAEVFEPFVYGDHLWQAMLKFATYKGMEALRKPRGIPQAA
ncbi:MAG: isopenicillin N synthase family oxygenase [Hyphomicrobiales bacterium]|nr:isopenicillin N synthase family oxygenase [Hyphomicrobiales bacterium]